MKGSLLYISRTVEFASAHRLHREDWSEERNRDVFGKCANPYGHGHNYVLEVTVCGEADEETGMLVHFQSLKRLLHEEVVAPLDHRHLNHDVPFLAGVLPTSENLIRILWERLSRHADGQRWRLHRLKLASNPRNAVEYFGP